MKKFLYLRDPLFLFCLALYFFNRFVLKAMFAGGFFHTSLNDVICIPFWLPIMLGTMRVLRLRLHDAPPQFHEILIPLFLWSLVFEIFLPHQSAFRGLAIADPTDIFCYASGALFASVFWKFWYRV